MEEYVITGIGLYDSMGRNVEQCWQEMLKGETAVKHFDWPEDNPKLFPKTHKALLINVGARCDVSNTECPPVFAEHWKNWDTYNRTTMLTVNEAMVDSGLTSTAVGAIFGSAAASNSVKNEILGLIDAGISRCSPRRALNLASYFHSTQCAAVYKITGPTFTVVSTCTTGLNAIETAITYMKADDKLDAMIVGAADWLVGPMMMYWFQTLGALSSEPCRPFDKSRDGINLGEGSATLIIEPLSKAQARGAKIYGTIKSMVNSTQWDSDTSPDPEGKATVACMQEVLDKAGITADDIGYVNAHATGTVIGDIIEYNAISKLFPGRVVVSHKGQLGHSLVPSGIIELIYTMLVLRDNISPPNVGLTDKIGDGEVNLITETTKLDNPKYAIKNSFGFGGRNSSLVYKKW